MGEPHHRQDPPVIASAVAASSQLSDTAIEAVVKQPSMVQHATLLDADDERVADLFEDDHSILEQPTTSRKELWSYYLYLNGPLTLNFRQSFVRNIQRLMVSR